MITNTTNKKVESILARFIIEWDVEEGAIAPFTIRPAEDALGEYITECIDSEARKRLSRLSKDVILEELYKEKGFHKLFKQLLELHDNDILELN